MTKHKCRMTKEARNQNDEAIQELVLSFDIRHSGFVIRH
jgi:hypothetical protein